MNLIATTRWLSCACLVASWFVTGDRRAAVLSVAYALLFASTVLKDYQE